MEEKNCPNCKVPMKKKNTSISSNMKFINFECEACTHKATKCLGPQ